jgi:hypothetical protein
MCPESLMTSRTRSSMFRAILLAIVLQATAYAQNHQEPVTANLCEVVASPAAYNKKMMSVEGILLSSKHSLALYNL